MKVMSEEKDLSRQIEALETLKDWCEDMNFAIGTSFFFKDFRKKKSSIWNFNFETIIISRLSKIERLRSAARLAKQRERRGTSAHMRTSRHMCTEQSVLSGHADCL